MPVPPPDDPRLLFVYGTLRRGSGALMADRLAAEATWVGEATVSGVLYDTGRYPACVRTEDAAQRVKGEVYALHPESSRLLLAQLDQYEGFASDARYESLFVREAVTVRFDDGSEQRAWIYLYNESLERASLVASGDWMAR